MSDVHTPEQRRRNMAAIKSRNTKPELVVQEIVRSLGYSFDLHATDLPGKPDLVIRRRKKVILVHGCYFHRHTCPNGQVIPQTRTEFYLVKFKGNVARVKKSNAQLRRMNWKILTVWECQTRTSLRAKLVKRIQHFIEGETK